MTQNNSGPSFAKASEDKQNQHQGVFAKKFFCGALTESQEAIVLDADTLEKFQGILATTTSAWIDFQTDDFENEGKKAAKTLGFSDTLTSLIFSEKTATYQDFDKEMGIVLPAVQVKDLVVEIDPVIILMKDNFVLTLHTSRIGRFIRLRRYAETLLRKIPTDAPQNEKLTILLIRLIDENISRNFEKLRDVEEQSDELNEWLMDPTTPITKIGPQIHRMKHALMVYLRLLWSTGDILNTLRYGDAELISDKPELLDKLSGLAQDINGQIALTEHLSNVITSGLEVLQSIYNNQLQAFNNRLALLISYLTIIGTAVLVPNTLGTILSGSAFNLTKEDLWWYIPLLIGSTIASTYGVYIWVKRKGWLSLTGKKKE